ncbi:LysR family transcriptional regulator [Sphingobium fluviale]|uniref:LysR family transcriptional regulator n=1 Tax=Sphingobium fluviale TaxID=2506423 RepID=A0A4Q1KKQ2_9SPHN|nr:LysR family transcriptional regulator [Sphingobium fluviale]RXR29274.1 LysR family transcriptional regulator [Sphingobium fluviale]
MHQKWDGIDEFVAVATAGSFANAAARLGASTSQVSRAVIRLEERLDTQLFYRTTRKVALTDTGRALVERFRELIRQRDEALDLITDVGEPQGELRITCSTALGSRFVAPIVARMAKQFPRLSVNLELSNRIVDLVAEGFDLAIRTGNLADSGLIATRIASRRLYLCASPDYLKPAGRPQTIEDLANFECLRGTASTWHFQMDGVSRTVRPNGRWRCNSGDAVLEAALLGLGICQLPEFYVLPQIANGALEPLLEAFRPRDEPIWAVYPQRRHLLPKVQHLISILRVELGAALGQ